MSDPVRLTPDALESLLAELDRDAFASFVADLYERAGRGADRQGNVITAVTAGGDRERALVWSDDRGQVGRLLGRDPGIPDVEDVDAVVTRRRDDPAATTVAETAGGRLVDAADLHGRLLYAVDREVCRELCREHLGVEVDPRPAPGETSDGIVPGELSRRRVVLVAVAVCGLFVAGAAGLPGSGLPGSDALDPGGPAETVTPVDADDVTPVGGGAGDTPTPTETRTRTPPPTEARTPTPPPTVPPEELVTLQPDPCRSAVEAGVPCLVWPPRPLDSTHPETVVAGSNARINGTFLNDYESTMTRALVDVRVPPDWNIRTVGGPTYDAVGDGSLVFGKLLPGESRSVSWSVSPPGSAEGGRYDVTVVSEWTVPNYDGFGDDGNVEGTSFRLTRNYTYLVKPSACEGIEPCSLLANDSAGTESFRGGEPRIGATNVTSGYLYNPYDRTLTNGTVTLDPPDEDWEVSPVEGVTFDALASGESQPVAWNLSVSESTFCGREYTLSGETAYELDGGDRITVPFSVTVSPEPSDGGDCLVLRAGSGDR